MTRPPGPGALLVDVLAGVGGGGGGCADGKGLDGGMGRRSLVAPGREGRTSSRLKLIGLSLVAKPGRGAEGRFAVLGAVGLAALLGAPGRPVTLSHNGAGTWALRGGLFRRRDTVFTFELTYFQWENMLCACCALAC